MCWPHILYPRFPRPMFGSGHSLLLFTCGFTSGLSKFEMFRNFLFSRVIPNLSRIGLLTDEVRPKFEALGLLEYEHAPDDFECDWAEMKKPLEKFGQIPTNL